MEHSETATNPAAHSAATEGNPAVSDISTDGIPAVNGTSGNENHINNDPAANEKEVVYDPAAHEKEVAMEDPAIAEKQAVAPQKASWWSRKSLLTKILLIAIPAFVVIGLAVGLGVGLTVGQDGGDDGDDGDDDSSDGSSGLLANATAANSTAPGYGSLWQPKVGDAWQITLIDTLKLKSDATTISPYVPVYDIDLFTNDVSVMQGLHHLGIKVICYFSAGSYEDNRPDSGNFTKSDMGGELNGWPGEYWLNLNSTNVRNIMKGRIALAKQKGCDAIDPDNVDGYSNSENNIGLTKQDSIDFVKFLATEAKAQGMSTGLKNAGDIIPQVLPYVAFSVNEQCHKYQECTTYSPFIKAGKPVFNIEYPDGAPDSVSASDVKKYCSTSGDDGKGAQNFSTVLKDNDLHAGVEYCNGTIFHTEVN